MTTTTTTRGKRTTTRTTTAISTTKDTCKYDGLSVITGQYLILLLPCHSETIKLDIKLIYFT